jgi:hypothetical protein
LRKDLIEAQESAYHFEQLLKGAQNSLEQATDEFRTEKGSLTNKIQELESRVDSLIADDEHNSSSLNTENVSLAGTNRALQTQVDLLRSELDKERSEHSKTSIEFHSVAESVKSVTASLNKVVRERTALQTELTTEKQRVDNLQNELDDTTRAFKSEISTLKADLDDSHNQFVELQHSIFDTTTGPNSSIANEFALVSMNPPPPTVSAGTSGGGGQIVVAGAVVSAQDFAKQMSELLTREEKKSIPFFKGKPDDADVQDWLREADRVGRSNDWDETQKLKFYTDRLKGDALDWHLEYAEEQQALDYATWRTAFISRFRTAAAIERLRTQLLQLRQKEDQNTTAFIAKLNKMYNSLNGKDPIRPANNAAQDLKDMYAANILLRGTEKKRLLINGLLPKVQAELWPRLPRDASYEQLCELAEEAENALMNREFAQNKTINAVLETISDNDKEQNRILISQQQDISTLKQQIQNLSLSADSAQVQDHLSQSQP